jgi:FKBP-type peptidyl-prolyl cis-trans isomerase
MKRTSTLLLSLVTILFVVGGCSSGGFKKTQSGLLYKIVSAGSGPVAKKGEFLKVHYTQLIRDSVLSSSAGGLATYAPVDSVGALYNPAEVFNKLRKGDSVLIVMLADSLEKKQGMLPPFIKKGDKVSLRIRVVDILTSEADVRKDQTAQLESKKEKEIESIQKYLDEKNIKTVKSPKGVFVQIESKGDGPAVDSGKAVHVNYTGTTFEGKVFDSNVDTAFGHHEPYVFVIGQRGAIEGWDDGLRMLNKGGKAKLYIPSMLAYGPNPPPGAPFKAYENLIFDVDVLDVTEPEKAAPMMPPGMRHPSAPDPRTAPAPAKSNTGKPTQK